MNNNSEKDMTTKGNILNATLELIKTDGLENITLRKIAALAGVNLALINYYFGSKDKLINEALKIQLASFRKHFLILDEYSLSPKDRLKTFLVEYVNSVIKYPELIKEILGKGTITFESQFEYQNYMKTSGINKIKATLQEITGEQDSDKLTMMLMHILPSVFFPAMIACKKDVPFVRNAIPIERQIDHLFQHYFARYS
ncbi:TetR/AcrR family transcriptional regulator [Neobacillus jeddahensis]|uniref:TetR/AcrR family transcriptional regulator n=1 Tax=Neobacillus jeddahensis TaxID=1461580 RepID=UPI00058AD4D8|nr:TetR/AcrR family transcriptional regulator [Neobacillus jeddahensis]